MARDVRKLLWVPYVPKAFGIRDAFEDGTDKDPVTVDIHPMSATERRTYQERVVVKVKKDRTLSTPNAGEIEKAVFVANVRNVRNYSFTPDSQDAAEHLAKQLGRPVSVGQKVDILTAEDLWAVGEPEIVADIAKAVQEGSELEDGRLDLLSSRSAGTPRATGA